MSQTFSWISISSCSLMTLAAAAFICYLFITKKVQTKKGGPSRKRGTYTIMKLAGRECTVNIGNNVKTISVPYPIYPDGVGVVVPSFAAPSSVLSTNQFLVVLPEAENRIGKCATPFYEELNIERDLPLVDGLGSSRRPRPYPSSTSPDAGTFWLFGLFYIQDSNKWAAFLHGERHPLGIAPPSYKSQLVSYSTDLVTWTDPLPIIETPKFNGTEGTFQGAGDSSFVYDVALKEFRCYFFEAALGMGLARSKDPEGKPGTWEVRQGGTTFSPALGATSYKSLPVNAGNPHVLSYVSPNGQEAAWMMVAGEWGKSELCVAFSEDGYVWPVIKRVPFPESPAQTPLYFFVVNQRGGTYETNAQMRLYWCSTQSGQRLFKVRDLTVTI